MSTTLTLSHRASAASPFETGIGRKYPLTTTSRVAQFGYHTYILASCRPRLLLSAYCPSFFTLLDDCSENIELWTPPKCDFSTRTPRCRSVSKSSDNYVPASPRLCEFPGQLTPGLSRRHRRGSDCTLFSRAARFWQSPVMADFRQLALEFVLADDEAKQTTLAKKAASGKPTNYVHSLYFPYGAVLIQRRDPEW